jgi:hypothetical protein
MNFNDRASAEGADSLIRDIVAQENIVCRG